MFFKNYMIFLYVLLFSTLSRADRSLNVDINGFLDTSTQMVINAGNKMAGAAVVLTAIGLMIPGFREATRRALPWTILGVLGILLVTKYWN